jgi:hypothetical protein
MTAFKTLLFILASLFASPSLLSQGFTPPSDSNAVVYFVRVSSFGAAVSFEYFHNEDFIGIFKGKNYMRYELQAGEHLLWASTENKEFLQCDLRAGETYLVLVNVKMGGWKARVGLEPVTEENPDFERVKKLVYEKSPRVTEQSLINSTQKKLDKRGFVQNIMQRYENDWKYDNSKTKKNRPEHGHPY